MEESLYNVLIYLFEKNILVWKLFNKNAGYEPAGAYKERQFIYNCIIFLSRTFPRLPK
jgi:hypothetical protein